MSSMGRDALVEELFDIRKKMQREKFRATSKHTQMHDPITIYTGVGPNKMPSELIQIRYNFQSDFIEAMTEPICIELALQSLHRIKYVESVMVRYMPLADIMYDDTITGTHPMIAGDFGPLPDDFVDTTKLPQGDEAE